MLLLDKSILLYSLRIGAHMFIDIPFIVLFRLSFLFKLQILNKRELLKPYIYTNKVIYILYIKQISRKNGIFDLLSLNQLKNIHILFYYQSRLKMHLDSSKQKMQNQKLQNTVQEIKILYESMLTSENKGDYVQAQKTKQKIVGEQKKLDTFNMSQMQNDHNNEIISLQTQYNERLNQCNNKWGNQLDTYMQECKRNIQSIDSNNKEQINALREGLQEKLPVKLKESYQLLNLREMEHHMSKQKNFPQAQLIQTKIRNQYNQELEVWNGDRNAKIQQAVTNLKSKHSKDRDLLNKKIQIQLEDYNNEWHREKINLSQRFQNSFKQLKAFHERQASSYKKHFKTKGGIFSQKFREGAAETINY